MDNVQHQFCQDKSMKQLFFTSSMVWVLLASVSYMEFNKGVVHLDNAESSVNKEGDKCFKSNDQTSSKAQEKK
eukprot:2142326-Ditylum_brightwellii.AAC.1